MKKAMFFMLVFVAILFGGIFFLKQFIFVEQKKAIKKTMSQLIVVSATTAKTSSWAPQLKVTGSLRTVKGVEVTTELGGMIEKIYFTAGTDVEKGDLLVALDTRPDVAKLHQLEADAKFAKITYYRDKRQFAFGAVSKEKLDSDESQYKSTAAAVVEQKATIAKKIIRAPFTGRLGISAVNPGQYLNPGDKVVSLETLNPIYVDFYLPQQDLNLIFQGQAINMTLDRAPGETFSGKITTINPIVNTDVRNVEVEATLLNPQQILLPGMFTNVDLYVGMPKEYITLPYNAITFNPYGSIVFILTKMNKKQNGKEVWKADQKFISTGETHGNVIAVTKGIKKGDMVVTSGQLKLRNDSLVTINNTKVPERK